MTAGTIEIRNPARSADAEPAAVDLFLHAAKVLNPHNGIRHLESIDGMPSVGRTGFTLPAP